MASIKQNYSGHWTCLGPYSLERAEKVFQKDIDRIKRDRNLKSFSIKKSEGVQEFEANFSDGWNSWSMSETLDYRDNNTYARCC